MEVGIMVKVRSWLEELNNKYHELASGGNIRRIDKANDIILKAIAKLDKELKH